MQIYEHEDEYLITVEFVIHRAIVATYHILKAFHRTETAVFAKKKQIIEEITHRLYFKGKEKEIIKAWSKIDSRFEELYKILYPRGGYRKNSGRPQGTRTKRTERLNQTITPEEKAAVEDLLKRMRQNENKI